MTSGCEGHVRSFPPTVSLLIIRVHLYCIHFIKEILFRPAGILHKTTIILDHSSVLHSLIHQFFPLPAVVHYPQRHQTAANAHSAVLIIRKKDADHLPHPRTIRGTYPKSDRNSCRCLPSHTSVATEQRPELLNYNTFDF